MGRSEQSYNDEFENTMEYYVLPRLDSKGYRLSIRNSGDLRVLFERLDDERRDQSSPPKFTNEFINRIIHTNRAQSLIGKTIGRFGGVRPVQGQGSYERQTQLNARAIELKSRGKEIYRYDGGFAYKSVYKNRYGKSTFRFRDVDSGKLIKSKGKDFKFT